MKPGAEGGPFVEQIKQGVLGQKFVKALLCGLIQQRAEGMVLPLKTRNHVMELRLGVQEGADQVFLGVKE